MISLREVAAALVGAWRLAKLDRQGLAYFDLSLDGARRSFFAAVLSLPCALGLVLAFDWAAFGEVPLWRIALVESLAYLLGWTAYVTMMADIASALDRTERYFGFVCVYNWTMVLQVVLYAAVTGLVLTGLLSPLLQDVATFGAFCAVVLYQWFITRETLAVGSLVSGVLVFLDLVLAVMLSLIAETLIQRGAVLG